MLKCQALCWSAPNFGFPISGEGL
uniref:Uncharacterized protein n=1 Tax=Rhizophora mucronata TaxID=61149 RepID=A0A2P2PXG5_RHIMU